MLIIRFLIYCIPFPSLPSLLSLTFLPYFLSKSVNITTNKLLQNYPQPFSRFNRILGIILVYNFKRIETIMIVLDKYRSFCESGWFPTLLILTTKEPTKTLKILLNDKLWCYFIQDNIHIEWKIFHKNIGLQLADASRRYLSNKLNEYDLFIYQEEDMILTLNHLNGYLYETRKLYNLSNDKVYEDYMIGFQRYRHTPTNHSDHDLRDILYEDQLEEIPFFQPICLQNEPYLQIRSSYRPASNPHQAVFILTREQVDMLNRKCNFLNQSLVGKSNQAYTREYMSSLSIFENNIIRDNCGMKKIIPAERFQTFAILHSFTTSDKFFHKSVHYPLLVVDIHIRAGYMQMDFPVIRAGYFDELTCWTRIINKTLPDMIELTKTISEVTNTSVNDLYTLILDRNTVYFIENGIKQMIPSRSIFESHHFIWSKVIHKEHIEGFEYLPVGPNLE